MAKQMIRLTGAAKINRNLKKWLDGTTQKSHTAFIKAAIIIRRDMAQTNPKVPIDTRNLDYSWFVATMFQNVNAGASFVGSDASKLSQGHGSAITQAKQKVMQSRMPMAVIGFSAYYAIYVHEMPANNKFKKSGAGPKFLEKAINRNKDRVLLELGMNIKTR